MSADLVDGGVVVLAGGVVALLGAMVSSLVGVGDFRIPKLRVLGTLGGVSGLLFVYLAFFWATTGRSVGKQLIGLRLVSRDGREVGVGRAVLRSALCVAFPVGLLWVLVSSRNASVQDLLVRTAVVYDWRAHAPAGPMGRESRPNLGSPARTVGEGRPRRDMELGPFGGESRMRPADLPSQRVRKDHAG